jgi:hypothetical protein
MQKSEKDWKFYCFSVQHVGGDAEKIGNVFSSILGEDVRDIKIVLNREISTDDTVMVFVECRNIEDYVTRLSTNRSIATAVPSLKHPAPISERELNAFFRSIVKKEHKFSKGDFVKPMVGCLAGLYGMVLSVKEEMVEVLFRFHMRSIRDKFTQDQLIFQYKISDVLGRVDSVDEMVKNAMGNRYAYNNKVQRPRPKSNRRVVRG